MRLSNLKGSFKGEIGPYRLCKAYIGLYWLRGAKATQQGLLGTNIGYWALLGLIGKTWLSFPRL